MYRNALQFCPPGADNSLMTWVLGGVVILITGVIIWASSHKTRLDMAATMKNEHCRQIAYAEGQTSTGIGTGVAVSGKVTPVAGVVTSTEDDQYTYTCDGGKTYTLSYDISKYS